MIDVTKLKIYYIHIIVGFEQYFRFSFKPRKTETALGQISFGAFKHGRKEKEGREENSFDQVANLYEERKELYVVKIKGKRGGMLYTYCEET